MRGEDVKIPMVYLGPEPWDGLWRNRHHLMSRFARDRPVVYIEPPLYLKQLRRQLVNRGIPKADLFRAKMQRVRDNLFVYRTGALCPVSGSNVVSNVSWMNWRLAVDRSLTRQGIRKYILWISRPLWYLALDQMDYEMLIYHVVDEYSEYSTVTEESRRDILQTEEKILNKADLVIVVSEALLESKSKKNPHACLVTNGVDIDAYDDSDTFDTIPGPLANIPRPRIGYSGLIAGRLDLGLLLELAKKRPNYSILLLGSVNEHGCESMIRKLRDQENIYFLGLKPADEVPAYVRAFDCCIIPYAKNERAANADPLKLYEYAAAGKETICTDFAAARKPGIFCHVTNSSDEFISQIDEVIRNPTEDSTAREARDWARANSWGERVHQISTLVSDQMTRRNGRSARSQ